MTIYEDSSAASLDSIEVNLCSLYAAMNASNSPILIEYKLFFSNPSGTTILPPKPSILFSTVGSWLSPCLVGVSIGSLVPSESSYHSSNP